jgi:hypothetical protein
MSGQAEYIFVWIKSHLTLSALSSMMMKMFNNIANRSTNTPMMTWKSDEKYNEKQKNPNIFT